MVDPVRDDLLRTRVDVGTVGVEVIAVVVVVRDRQALAGEVGGVNGAYAPVSVAVFITVAGFQIVAVLVDAIGDNLWDTGIDEGTGWGNVVAVVVVSRDTRHQAVEIGAFYLVY